VAGRIGVSLGIEEVIAWRLPLIQGRARGNANDEIGQTGRDFKSVFGQLGRGVEPVGPVELAVILMGRPQGRDGAGNADGMTGENRGAEAERLAVFVVEEVRHCAGRRRFAAIINGQITGLGIEIEQESAASEPGALGFNQAQNSLDRDRGVNRITALAQGFQSGFDSVWIGCGHHDLGRRGLDLCRALGRLRAARTRKDGCGESCDRQQ